MTDLKTNVQQLLSHARSTIEQMRNDATEHREANKRLAGALQRYADLYTAQSAENERLRSTVRTQENLITQQTADIKSLTEQNRTLITDFQFMINQYSMIAADTSAGDSQLLDSTHMINALFETPKAIETLPDLTVDLNQTRSSFLQSASGDAAGSTQDEALSDADDIALDIDAIESEIKGHEEAQSRAA